MSDLSAATELCRLLGDRTRLRLLALVAHESLSVAELVRVTELAQSRVSTHLGKLREAGLVRVRGAGNSTFYDLGEMPPLAAEAWKLLRRSTRDPLLDQDRVRAAEIVSEREKDGSWADSVAGRMARHYSPGRTWESFARGAIGLVELGHVLDVASGDAAMAELLSPRVQSLTCLDRSPRVTRAGARRLAHIENVRFVRGDMNALPFADESFDAALLMSALCYGQEAPRVLREIARVIAPGGKLVAVTLEAHQHATTVSGYGHVQHGFDPKELEGVLLAAGFEVHLCAPTQREKRAPHFSVLTVHASKGLAL